MNMAADHLVKPGNSVLSVISKTQSHLLLNKQINSIEYSLSSKELPNQVVQQYTAINGTRGPVCCLSYSTLTQRSRPY